MVLELLLPAYVFDIFDASEEEVLSPNGFESPHDRFAKERYFGGCCLPAKTSLWNALHKEALSVGLGTALEAQSKRKGRPLHRINAKENVTVTRLGINMFKSR